MIDWPTDIDKPRPQKIFMRALEMCGTDWWGCAAGRAIASILLHDMYLGKPRLGKMRWEDIEREIKERKGTMQRAYSRSKDRRVARKMAMVLMTELLQEQRSKEAKA